jgi:hypothetical protein
MIFLLNVYGNVVSCTGSSEALRCDQGMQNMPNYIWMGATALHRILLQALLGVRTFAGRAVRPAAKLWPSADRSAAAPEADAGGAQETVEQVLI